MDVARHALKAAADVDRRAVRHCLRDDPGLCRQRILNVAGAAAQAGPCDMLRRQRIAVAQCSTLRGMIIVLRRVALAPKQPHRTAAGHMPVACVREQSGKARAVPDQDQRRRIRLRRMKRRAGPL